MFKFGQMFSPKIFKWCTNVCLAATKTLSSHTILGLDWGNKTRSHRHKKNELQFIFFLFQFNLLKIFQFKFCYLLGESLSIQIPIHFNSPQPWLLEHSSGSRHSNGNISDKWCHLAGATNQDMLPMPDMENVGRWTDIWLARKNNPPQSIAIIKEVILCVHTVEVNDSLLSALNDLVPQHHLVNLLQSDIVGLWPVT